MKKYIQLIILPVLFLWLGYVQAQTEINSLAELKDHLGDNDGNFVMTPVRITLMKLIADQINYFQIQNYSCLRETTVNLTLPM